MANVTKSAQIRSALIANAQLPAEQQKTRWAIAKELGVEAALVYSVQKRLDNPSKSTRTVVIDGVEYESESAYIRQAVANGEKKYQVAKKLGKPYSVVYGAMKRTPRDSIAAAPVAQDAPKTSKKSKKAA